MPERFTVWQRVAIAVALVTFHVVSLFLSYPLALVAAGAASIFVKPRNVNASGPPAALAIEVFLTWLVARIAVRSISGKSECSVTAVGAAAVIDLVVLTAGLGALGGSQGHLNDFTSFVVVVFANF